MSALSPIVPLCLYRMCNCALWGWYGDTYLCEWWCNSPTLRHYCDVIYKSVHRVSQAYYLYCPSLWTIFVWTAWITNHCDVNISSVHPVVLQSDVFGFWWLCMHPMKLVLMMWGTTTCCVIHAHLTHISTIPYSGLVNWMSALTKLLGLLGASFIGVLAVRYYHLLHHVRLPYT